MSMSLTNTSLRTGTRGWGRLLGQQLPWQVIQPLTLMASPQLWQQPADTQQHGSPSNNSTNTTAPLWVPMPPRPRSKVRLGEQEATLLNRLQLVPMSPILPSVSLITAPPFPRSHPGPSSPIMRTTRPRVHTTLIPARHQGCTLPSLIWAPPRGPCTLP